MFSERTHWRLTQNRFTQAVEEVRARGTAILDLTASNPTRVGLKYDSARILSALQSEHALDYDPQAKGLLSAREAVARPLQEALDRLELLCPPDDVGYLEAIPHRGTLRRVLEGGRRVTRPGEKRSAPT